MLLHGGAALLLPLIAAFLWRDHGQRVDARLAALAALGGAAFALVATPGVIHLAEPWHAPLMALSAGNPFVCWLLSRALLDDEFALRRWHLAVWAIMAGSGVVLAVMAHDRSIGRLVLTLPAMAWMLLAAVQAFASWRGDLVEQRRRLRLRIVVAVTVYMLGSHLLVLVVRDGGLWSNTVSAAVLLLVAVSVARRMLHMSQDLFAEASPAMQPAPTLAEPPLPEIEQPDPRLLDALNELMQVEQVYREENLTIAALAERMKLSEPRLRQLINKELGHRNFSAFLNAYRVEDAKRALSDHRYAEVPILTISVEAGFQSLGPFNRAFKAITGMTPTDFRRVAATGVPAESSMG